MAAVGPGDGPRDVQQELEVRKVGHRQRGLGVLRAVLGDQRGHRRRVGQAVAGESRRVARGAGLAVEARAREGVRFLARERERGPARVVAPVAVALVLGQDLAPPEDPGRPVLPGLRDGGLFQLLGLLGPLADLVEDVHVRDQHAAHAVAVVLGDDELRVRRRARRGDAAARRVGRRRRVRVPVAEREAVEKVGHVRQVRHLRHGPDELEVPVVLVDLGEGRGDEDAAVDDDDEVLAPLRAAEPSHERPRVRGPGDDVGIAREAPLHLGAHGVFQRVALLRRHLGVELGLELPVWRRCRGDGDEEQGQAHPCVLSFAELEVVIMRRVHTRATLAGLGQNSR